MFTEGQTRMRIRYMIMVVSPLSGILLNGFMEARGSPSFGRRLPMVENTVTNYSQREEGEFYE